MQPVIKTTADGSSTLYLPSLNENYHSVNGAVQESVHVFINAGLKWTNSNPVNILTLLETKNSRVVNYHGIEPYPPESELINKLNYPEYLNLNDADKSIFSLMHQIPCGKDFHLREDFTLRKITKVFSEMDWEIKYDLIYFDAFAPAVQPELWTENIFSELYEQSQPGGIMVTYCAKGEVRRAMQRAGFKVERLPGPPGKREMLRATKL
jgi:hypothetical protein